MLGRGVKRKRGCLGEAAKDGEDGTSWKCEVSYLQQRQLVLSLCLVKLQGCQVRSEPSLHRSVLLANTLRQIQEEMRQEGEAPPPNYINTPPDRVDTPLHSPDSQPSQSMSPHLYDMGRRGEALTCSSCTDVEGFDIALLPAPLHSSSSSSEEEIFTNEPRSLGLSSLIGTREVMNSTGYLADLALDDIFEDIDTSMYDSSDVSSILAFCPSRCILHTSTEDEGFKLFSGNPSLSPLQLSLSDLNELDQVMELLVGS